MVLVAIPATSALNTNGVNFGNQETIYIDFSGFRSWLDGGAVIKVFTYYGDNTNWNVENSADDSNIHNSSGWAKAKPAEKITNDIYKFRIDGDNVGAVKIIRLNPSLNAEWDNSGFLYSTNKNNNNCIKITGWGNSATWTTYQISATKAGSQLTATPSQSIIDSIDKDELYLVDASFYDYYTDEEVLNGWRNNTYSSTHGDWEPYGVLNKAIAEDARANGVRYPLYFGNFYDKNDNYKSNNGYYSLYNFSNWVNNSSRLGGFNRSVINLAGSDMTGNFSSNIKRRMVKYQDGATMPIFDANWLTNKGLGTVVDTDFPTRIENRNGVKYYVFDSNKAKDNIWFTGYGNSNLTLNYGKGSANGTYDALDYYSDPKEAKGYGFFPFDHGGDAKDFGFGMRIDVPFNVAKDGMLTDLSGNKIAQRFEFTGDDDVWVYIDGVLVLDLGGDHKKSHGVIDLHEKKSTVNTGTNDILNNGKMDTRIFNFPSTGFMTGDGKSGAFDNTDTLTTHRLTMFYMERGMIESNLTFEFNFAPLLGGYIVTETIDTTNVNPGLRDDVTGLDSFTFYPIEKNADGTDKKWEKGLSYTSGDKEYKDTNSDHFSLGSGDSAIIGNFFEVGNNISIRQQHSKSCLTYDTSWVYKDNVNKNADALERGNNLTEPSLTTREHPLLDTVTGNKNDYAEHRVDFINTPLVGDVVIDKDSVDFIKQKLDKNDLGEDEEFAARVAIDFGGDNGPFYNFDYTANDLGDQTAESGYVKLKNGREITIHNVPVGSTITVTEDTSDNFIEPSYTSNGTKLENKSLTIGVTNTRVDPDDAQIVIGVNKTITVNGHNASGSKFSADLRKGYTFELKDGDKQVIDTKEVKNYSSSGSITFKTIVFTVDSTKKSTDSVEYVYISPETFKNGGKMPFTFTVSEVQDYKGLIEYPKDYEIEVEVYYDKVNNILSTTQYGTQGSVNADLENKVNTGEVEIKKTVVRQDGKELTDEQKEKEFEAKVEFSVDEMFTVLNYYYTVNDGGKTSLERLGDDGIIKLKNDRTITFSGLPVGTKVTVNEIQGNDYIVSYEPSSQSAKATKNGATISVTNTIIESGSAVIGVTKEFADSAKKAGLDKSTDNTYKFTMTNAEGTPAYSDTVSIDLKDGVKSADFKAITFPADMDYSNPVTFKYTIKELDTTANDVDINKNDKNIIYDGSVYTVVYTVERKDDKLEVSKPVITKGNDSAESVVFTNGYEVGNATVTKEVVGVEPDEMADLSFAITVKIAYPNGTDVEETVTFSNANNWTKTYVNLPVGTKISVEEKVSKGFEVSYAPQTAEVKVGKDAAVKVINTLVKPGSAVIGVTKAFTDVAKNAGIDKNTYKFTLTNTDGSYTDTVSVIGAGSANFDEISFPDVGTYTYTVKELNEGADNVIYDGSVYTVIYTVDRDGAKLVVSDPEIKKGDDSAKSIVFTNDYEKGNAKFKKVARDIDGTEFYPDVEFKFTVEIDYDGTGYKAPVEVALKAGKTYTIPEDLPVGTKVRVTETDTKGFINTQPIQVITVDKANETASITVTNQRPQAGETSVTLSATKILTGAVLSKNDFSFNISGEGADSEKSYTNDADGKVTFDTINYKYSKNDNDKSSGNTVVLHDSDFTDGKAKRTYTIKEKKGSNSDVEYDNTEYKAVVTITKEESASSISLSSAVSYYKDGDKVDDGAVFKNSIRTGMVTIYKTNQANKAVEDVTFGLYKVSGDNLSRDEVMEIKPVETTTTDANGVAKFTDIALYTSDSVKLSDADKYQWYCVAEVEPANGYTINGELHFFRIPTQNSYELKFEYVNGRILSPTTGGEGMFGFRFAGVILMGLALLMFACYVIYVRKPARKRVDK